MNTKKRCQMKFFSIEKSLLIQRITDFSGIFFKTHACMTFKLFTKRTSAEKEITVVGSNDIYEAVCRKHYLE